MSPTDQFFTDGAAYEQLMGRWSRRVGDVFLEWLAPSKNLHWLDIGCGTGAFTEQIVASCAPQNVTGIDPSAEQLTFAKKRAGLEAAEFRVGDAQALTCSDGSFDIAVMALVIHFIPDPGAAVTEMSRVVRPGGWGATYVWDYLQAGSPIAPLSAAMKALGVQPPPPPSAHATSLSALEELWRSAGFVQIETRVVEISVEFTDFEELWSSMTVPVGPAGMAIADMSADMRARVRDTLRERMPPSPGGRIVYGARANAIKGRKDI